jgi:hypothetical protein
LPVFREYRYLLGGSAVAFQHVDRLAPGRPLRVVDLAQVQHVPLHHAPALASAVLYDAPIAVRLAILLARLASQKHADNMPTTQPLRKGVGRHYNVFGRFRRTPCHINQTLAPARFAKIGKNCGE